MLLSPATKLLMWIANLCLLANIVWSLCIHFQQIANAPTQHVEKKPRIDYKDILSEEEFAQFAELRELRKVLAEKDGVPVFGVFNNDQLAQMIQKGVENATQLKAIQGIGDNKVERYGHPFLEKLRQFKQVSHA